MIPIVVVGITAGLIIIASFLYRGRGRRVLLLRTACVGLFVATVCRSMEPTLDGTFGIGVDLLKRWALLAAQTSVVLLVLTFRNGPHVRTIVRGVCIAAMAVAVGEALLAGFLPVNANGSVILQEEVQATAERGQVWPFIGYQALYLSAFAAATAAVAIGCWLTLIQRNQPFAARLPVIFVLAGALGSMLFIASSLMDLFGIAIFGGPDVRTYMLIAVVSFFFIGLVLGVIRRLSISLRKTIAVHLAQEIILPLWKTTTSLQPNVKLPSEVYESFDDVMELSRLTIETHDALRLIREDDDPALKQLRRRHPSDPELSAELLRHLGGENSVPQLGWFTLALTKVKTLRLDDSEAFTSSLDSLYEIRLAMRSRENQGT